MNKKILAGVLAAFTGGFSAMTLAATPLMSSEWAAAACEAWNQNATLTDELEKSGWVKNDGGKGYKAMQIYRSDCENSPHIEMQIAEKDGKAMCIYGGPVKTTELDKSVDYIMHASTKNWVKMGKGDLGAMGAMMTFRLKFKGPKGEAMSNMGPFGEFLLLPGKVEGDPTVCPTS